MTDLSPAFNAQRNNGLIEAATRGWAAVVVKELDGGAAATASDAAGISVLELALRPPCPPEPRKQSAAMAAALIEKGARPEDIKNLMPGMERDLRSGLLLFAAKSGDAKTAARLLAEGADPGVQDAFGRSASSWAAQGGHVDIMRLLIGAGADVNVRNESGLTPLMFAAQNGHTVVVALLLDSGAQINAAASGQWHKGMTALMYAAAGGHAETTALLAERGAYSWMRDRDNRYAIDFGRQHPGIAEILSTPREELKPQREARELEANVVLQHGMPKMKPLRFRK